MPGQVCFCCFEVEPDPTYRSWTTHAGEQVYICLACRPRVLERGLAVIAFTRTDKNV